ncbi:hypothetical protein [Pedobacter sp. KBS0701]|uniref:hypothetical protein n=1 Tax=unclassified Pedobacter TaxID=2628915 RepID=UPI00110DD3D4|nr:hypothetical protein [Pedobacter sp. KBS0701]QDW27170.1 hypothetical protein FFJ24_021005 [Pedobacter sp. KBS0701]
MKNTSIFEQFDMVVSMTQQTINDQLTHLSRVGTIHPSFILVQTVEKGKYVYKVLDDASQIPDGCSYINANILPQINISNSGLDITFVLNMVSGTAAFWIGQGPMSQLTNFDIADWAYGIDVNMDLYKLEQDDIGKKIVVPPLVEAQLKNFTDNMFSVNSLLMDFESVDLLQFNPTHTTAGSSGDIGIEQMVLFMQFYLKWLIATGNPYVLGYAIAQTDQTQVPVTEVVPDELKPVGTTYSMYSDAVIPGKSNLNFVLATKGGFGHISGSPGTFDTNWIGDNEDINAKMIISHNDLVENLILRPLYENFQSGVFDQIKDNINVTSGNTYEQGRTFTSTGISYTISNVSSGNDQYVNTIDVSFNNNATSVDIVLKGHVQLYKEVDKDMGVCTAKAYAGGTVDWSGLFTIEATKDASGYPTLKVTNSSKIDNLSSDSDQNTCAKAFAWIGKILGGILDALTGGLDQGFFTGLFDGLLDLHIPQIGNMGVAFGNLSNAVRTTILLPGGQVFYFKTPFIDSEANFYLSLTYKTDH